MMDSSYCCNVLVPLPLKGTFTYLFSHPVEKGTLVRVPFRNTHLVGVITDPHVLPPQNILLKTGEILPFTFSKTHLDFLEKVASYTMIPKGLVLKMMLHKDPKIFELTGNTETNVDKTKKDSSLKKNAPPKATLHSVFCPEKVKLPFLNPAQIKAHELIDLSLEKKEFQVFLLDGITGSGKTEVYFYSVLTALKHKQKVLILLPEIGLTHPILKRFEERFGFTPHLWHSEATPKQKRLAWIAAISEGPSVFIGARSALFLPYKNLGFIVVDEEHDSSYKQEEQALYHGRDMAILRASIEKIPILLASATPSLETFVKAQSGKFTHLILSHRHGTATLPTVHILDRRAYKEGVVAAPLLLEIQKRLDKNEQSLLFLNRRGYAPITLCKACGFRFGCPGCTTALTFHQKKCTLLCHYCGHTAPAPKACPECLEEALIHFGPGIEKVVEEITNIFPKENLAILSSDLTPKNRRETWEKIYKEEAKIIIGTQLLAKGHHLPKLTLVGILDGDMGLMGADMRASERAFQLLQQVSGRAGREDLFGEVWIQTYQSEHPLFGFFKDHDRDGFYHFEMEGRRALSLPPYGKLAALIVSSFSSEEASKSARMIAHYLRPIKDIEVLGPVEAPLARLKSRFRFRILLKGGPTLSFGKLLQKAFAHHSPPPSVRLTLDIDPQNFY